LPAVYGFGAGVSSKKDGAGPGGRREWMPDGAGEGIKFMNKKHRKAAA